MSVAGGERLVIRRRWLRAKHWFLLAIFAAAAVYVVYLWATLGTSAWLVIGTLFVLSWNYNVAAAFVNSTVVSAGADGVTVRHGPLPSLFARNASADKSTIAQLYSMKLGALYAVVANLKSGNSLKLVAPLITPEQALFVEQQLERTLGLVDVTVAGELGSDALTRIDGKTPAGAASGAVLALAIPALIAATVGLFLFVASSDASGKLQASGTLGSWVFEPDACSSGQHEGFGGVILTSKAHPGRVVRVVRDPVRGSLVVVASQGAPNHVIGSDSCSRFDVSVVRTDTSINDIWAMDGRMTLECKSLSGSATFEGCH
jgi:hypothetical protein